MNIQYWRISYQRFDARFMACRPNGIITPNAYAHQGQAIHIHFLTKFKMIDYLLHHMLKIRLKMSVRVSSKDIHLTWACKKNHIVTSLKSRHPSHNEFFFQ